MASVLWLVSISSRRREALRADGDYRIGLQLQAEDGDLLHGLQLEHELLTETDEGELQHLGSARRADARYLRYAPAPVRERHGDRMEGEAGQAEVNPDPLAWPRVDPADRDRLRVSRSIRQSTGKRGLSHEKDCRRQRGRPAPAWSGAFADRRLHSRLSPHGAADPPENTRHREGRSPGATEKISYRMPAFFLDGAHIYYAPFKHHVGMFPPVKGDPQLNKDLARHRGEKGNPEIRARRADAVRS
jgi:hypothetical protein